MRRALAAALLLVASGAHAAGPNERIAHAARMASPGTYAKSWRGEPLYWTVVGAPGGAREALLSEEGAFEPIEGGWSLEPYLWVDGARIATQTLHHNAPNRLFLVEYPIAPDLTAGNEHVTVRFQPAPNGKTAGGTFGLCMLRKEKAQ